MSTTQKVFPPFKPRLVKLFYDYLVEVNEIPHFNVFAAIEGVIVPANLINGDGVITLNLNPSAIRHLHMDEKGVSFRARFNGVETDVYFPHEAIGAIYSPDNPHEFYLPFVIKLDGLGSEATAGGTPPTPAEKPAARSRAHLSVVPKN